MLNTTALTDWGLLETFFGIYSVISARSWTLLSNRNGQIFYTSFESVHKWCTFGLELVHRTGQYSQTYQFVNKFWAAAIDSCLCRTANTSRMTWVVAKQMQFNPIDSIHHHTHSMTHVRFDHNLRGLELLVTEAILWTYKNWNNLVESQHLIIVCKNIMIV